MGRRGMGSSRFVHASKSVEESASDSSDCIIKPLQGDKR